MRAHIRKNDAQERLARTREEWDRQCKQRQEERIRALKEQQARAREERERLRQEKLQQFGMEKPADYEERKKALEEEIRATQERYQENILQAEMKYRERMKMLEEELRARKEQLTQSAESVPRLPPKVAAGAFAMASELLKADALLGELRKMNPEWEVRRQAALRVSWPFSCPWVIAESQGDSSAKLKGQTARTASKDR